VIHTALGCNVIDSQITNTDFGSGPDAVPGFCGKAHYPWTGIVNVDLGIVGLDSIECDTIPAAELDEILDHRDSNPNRGERSRRKIAFKRPAKTYA
jgi:hypothetical protein